MGITVDLVLDTQKLQQEKGIETLLEFINPSRIHMHGTSEVLNSHQHVLPWAEH